ncbi:hypothetical protein SSX86_010312 [Deinandra increscens subsp. villosa]|uniref:CRAL/TRIO N-terminal domain-containing protein n=1 Tax=Deinandra increscens subsp. villosa TaxID=3103831 RepID=A0AAP0H2B2_9ASTR
MAEEKLTTAAAAAESTVVAVEAGQVAVVPEAVVCEKEESPESPEKEKVKVSESASFKEESNVAGELPDVQKKALEELKQLVQEALNKHEFTAPPPPAAEAEKPVKEETPAKEEKATISEVVVETKEEENATTVAVAQPHPPPETEVPEPEPEKEKIEAVNETLTCETEETIQPEKVSIWGIPLLSDERSDVVLLKFLRARDFKVKEAFTMLKNVVVWRKQFGIESLLEEDLGNLQEKVVYMHGVDKEGHPICYNAYGEYQNKELYAETFSTEEKRTQFLRWRIQFLEKSIRELDFQPGRNLHFRSSNRFQELSGTV